MKFIKHFDKYTKLITESVDLYSNEKNVLYSEDKNVNKMIDLLELLNKNVEYFEKVMKDMKNSGLELWHNDFLNFFNDYDEIDGIPVENRWYVNTLTGEGHEFFFELDLEKYEDVEHLHTHMLTFINKKAFKKMNESKTDNYYNKLTNLLDGIIRSKNSRLIIDNLVNKMNKNTIFIDEILDLRKRKNEWWIIDDSGEYLPFSEFHDSLMEEVYLFLVKLSKTNKVMKKINN